MPGNSRRRGAMRKPGSKKGAVVGSGAQRRKQLKGRGPTPKAEDRTGHPAARRAAVTKQRQPARQPARTAGGRGRPPTEVIVGRNAVVEALRARLPVRTLYVAERVDVDDRVREALQIVRDRQLPLLEVPRAELDRITGGAVHQGIALQVPPYVYAHPDDVLERAQDAAAPALLVALDGVTDPRNLGAVVRSAAAFGAHGVVVPERRAAGMTAAAWKASAGAAARIPVAQATNLARALRGYAEAGLFVVGLAADGDTELADLELGEGPLVVVIGSEGRGLSRIVAQACDVRLRIPIADEVESLNASVAAGIVLHAVAERRRQQP